MLLKCNPRNVSEYQQIWWFSPACIPCWILLCISKDSLFQDSAESSKAEWRAWKRLPCASIGELQAWSGPTFLPAAPFLRLAPCNPVPPSNHQSSRHTSSRPPALSSHNIFRSQRKSSPASDNNQGRGNYTHAPVLYPMTRRTPIAGWFPIRCRVSRSPRSPDGRRLALRQQSPHNSLARWHAPPRLGGTFLEEIYWGFSRVHGPVTHLAGVGPGEATGSDFLARNCSLLVLGKPSWKKKCFLLGIARFPPPPPPPPNLGNLYHFFLNAKNVDLSGIQRLKLKIMQKVTKKWIIITIITHIIVVIIVTWFCNTR